MRVMAAGMHHARVLRAERAAFRLLDRQRVHIRAQGDHLARQRALDQADHPRTLGGIGNAQLIQRVHDDLLRLKFRKAALRYAMEHAALLNDPILLRLYQRSEFAIIHSQFLHDHDLAKGSYLRADTIRPYGVQEIQCRGGYQPPVISPWSLSHRQPCRPRCRPSARGGLCAPAIHCG